MSENSIKRQEFIDEVSTFLERICETFIEDMDEKCTDEEFTPIVGNFVLHETLLTAMIVAYVVTFAPTGDKFFLKNLIDRARFRLKDVRKECESFLDMQYKSP